MSLPVAPLGSMSSINLPSHISTVPRERKAWEMALAAFLTGAGQQAGGQLATNALSKDFASQAGGTNASFGEKLLGGPNMGKEQYAQKTGNEAVMERLTKEINAGDTRLGKQIDASAMDTDKRLGAGKAEFDAKFGQQQTEFNTTRQQTDRRLDQGDAALENEKVMTTARLGEINARLSRMVQDGELDKAKAQQISAEIAKTGEETRSLKGMNDLMDDRRKPPAAPVNPLQGAKMPGKGAPVASGGPGLPDMGPKPTYDKSVQMPEALGGVDQRMQQMFVNPGPMVQQPQPARVYTPEELEAILAIRSALGIQQ